MLPLPDAEALLRRLGAPPRLLTHARLVGEAADAILTHLRMLGVPVDAAFVRLGVLFHDAGKILHPAELDGPGSRHEPDGEQLLLQHGVEAGIARCCRSHARWAEMEVSFEELLVALADKLWKGVRNPELERRVVEGAAERIGKAFWEVFEDLDTAFEEIAADGAERLERSR
jgi:hypothetical protein